MDRAIQHYVLGQLLGKRCLRAHNLSFAPLYSTVIFPNIVKVENARCEIHRTSEHASKRQHGNMVRRIRCRPPWVVFLTTSAFSRYPVRISTAKAGIFYRFMSVDGQLIFRSGCDVFNEMIYHVLAVGIFIAQYVVVVAHFEILAMGNIARFNLRNPQLVVQGKTVFHLRFVVGYSSWCFMVSY